jgi:hypothetical protein
MTLGARLDLRQPRRCLQMKLVLGPARILKQQKTEASRLDVGYLLCNI